MTGVQTCALPISLLPRRCAEPDIARGELVALPVPEIRLRRQIRIVFRRGAERSHAATAFLKSIEERGKAVQQVEGRKPGRLASNTVTSGS